MSTGSSWRSRAAARKTQIDHFPVGQVSRSAARHCFIVVDGCLVADVVVVEDVVVVVVLEVLAEGHDGRTETEYRHDRHRGELVRFAILVMADLSKEYINRTEQFPWKFL